MIIFEGKVFNLEGKYVPVSGDQRFVLNFTVSQYLGKNKSKEPLYRSFSVSCWDKRGEALHGFLKEKSTVAIKSDHYKAEGYQGKNGIDAKIKVELWSSDKIDVLSSPGDGGGSNQISDDDFNSGDKEPDDIPF